DFRKDRRCPIIVRGQLDEALRMLREEILPVFERIGDVRLRAVSLGRIADVLAARGELDEALRIRREEEVPVYERLGDIRELIVRRTSLAVLLLRRGRPEDRTEAREHLTWSRTQAVECGYKEASDIESVFRYFGMGIPPLP